MIDYQSGYDGRDLGNYAATEYNSRTQLIRENHEAHFRKLDGRDWTYRYDDAGNRLEEKNDGVVANDYNISNNRYSSITREPGAWVRGNVSSQGNEEVFLYAQEKAQSQAPERAGRYFSCYFDYSGTSINQDLFKAIVMDNGDTNVAKERMNIPPASESPAYDGNGNLTASWAYDFQWDAGDRLVKVSPKASTGFARSGAKAYTYEMRYDYMDRMVELVVKEHTGNGSSWSAGTQIRDLRFVYRGWDMVLEIDKSSKESLRGYAWGLDLSGPMGGAGGTRGLLGITELVGTHQTYFPAYDAMGHIYAMVDDVTGETAAEYEYDPYGKVIRSSGIYADINPFGYSTRYSLREIDLVYYGYRFYDPEHGRFLNKDPIEESGGNNLYAAFGNDPINRIDVLGLNQTDAQSDFVFILPNGAFDTDSDEEIYELTDFTVTSGSDGFEFSDGDLGYLGLDPWWDWVWAQDYEDWVRDYEEEEEREEEEKEAERKRECERIVGMLKQIGDEYASTVGRAGGQLWSKNPEKSGSFREDLRKSATQEILGLISVANSFIPGQNLLSSAFGGLDAVSKFGSGDLGGAALSATGASASGAAFYFSRTGLSNYASTFSRASQVGAVVTVGSVMWEPYNNAMERWHAPPLVMDFDVYLARDLLRHYTKSLKHYVAEYDRLGCSDFF